jgi:hypothetical protein
MKQSEIANNINRLFQEFTRDVLNIESATVPIPVMPNPFAAFLEEETRKTAADIEDLENQGKHIEQHIKMMREKLKSVNEKIAESKRRNKEKTETGKTA